MSTSDILELRNILPVLNDFVAGSFAGMASVLTGQPFDTLKVRLQAPNTFNGSIDCAKHLIMREGFSSLYSGVIPPLLTTSAVSALIFPVYSFTLNRISSGKENATTHEKFISGGVAGFFPTVIMCPAETIKIRLQSNPKKYSGVIDCFRKSTKLYGIKSLYVGYWATVYREVPAFGTYFSSYPIFHDNLQFYFNLSSLAASFLGGALAGALSWLIVYPIDVAKTNIQLVSCEVTSSSLTTSKMLRELCKKHGWRYLFRGLEPTLIRALPVNAVVFPVYGFTLDCLQQLQS